MPTEKTTFSSENLLFFGIILAIILFCFLAYFMNWEGIFHHDTKLNGDNYFSINMPGNYKKETSTLGTAEAPLFKRIYKYDNNSENNRLIFTVVEDNYPAAFSDETVNDLFLTSPESHLIQNYDSASNGFKETIEEQTNSSYVGYPSIDVVKKVDNLNTKTYLRYIKVGHIIYEISLTGEDNYNNYKDVFSKHANTFKILLNDQVKTN